MIIALEEDWGVTDRDYTDDDVVQDDTRSWWDKFLDWLE